MKKILTLCLALCLFALPLASLAETEIVVLAAASLTDAMTKSSKTTRPSRPT